MPVAAVAGLLEALVCQQFARHGINRIFTDIVAAFCGTIWAIAVQTVVPTVNANAAIIGALMVLTPGVALTMGVRDILNGDYLSGSIRLLDALLIAGSIAGGVVLGWIMARGLGWRDAGLDALFCPFCGGRHCNDQLWHHIPDAAAALPGLRPDRRGGLDGLHLLRGAVRFKPGDCDAGRHAAADRLRAVLCHPPQGPGDDFFCCRASFRLLPGAGIYYTAYYFLQGEQELFASKGGETFKGRAGPGAGHCAGVQSAAAGRA